MLRREIIVVCSEIFTKHTNILRRLNVELLNVKPGGTYSDHWALRVKKCEMYRVILQDFLYDKFSWCF
jgi:hypothetical protein